MDYSLTKGVLNSPPRYMPKHVSGDTDVDQTAREIKKLCGCFYTVLSPFLLLNLLLNLLLKDIPFGLGGGWDL
jgi:hypothetical protein